MNKKIKQTYLMPFVPFSSLSEKLCDEWETQGKLRYFVNKSINVIVSMSYLLATVGYGVASCVTETVDYRQWSKILSEQQLEQEKQFEIKTFDEFNKADLNENGSLDSFEFLSWRKGDLK